MLKSLGIYSRLFSTRVRFAPSPTGQLHLGSLRTALYNYLLSKKTNGSFILRIEDTDQTRLVPGAVEKMIQVFDWAGLNFDEGPHVGGTKGPYVQSLRLDIYKEYVDRLVKMGKAYPCFCSKERLQAIKDSSGTGYDRHCLSLSETQKQEYISQNIPHIPQVPKIGDFRDLVYGLIQTPILSLSDPILMKSDGFPTYHFANVVDDHLMEITHVLRGQEWLSSTPLHIILYRSFGWNSPEYVHLPLLINADGSKLSKRNGDVFVEAYKDYFPEALNNFVSLLGWSPLGTQEIFSMEELISSFDLSRINNSSAIFSKDRLDWINKQHLQRRLEKSPTNLVLELKKYLDSPNVSDDYLLRVIEIIKSRICKLSDIPSLCSYFFITPSYSTEESISLRSSVNADDYTKCIQSMLHSLENQTSEFKFDSTSLTLIGNSIFKEISMKPKDGLLSLRHAITGTKVGAGVFDTMSVLGKDRCIERLKLCLDLK